ncbi:FAD:protein FMN transferase [Thalassoglobus polymorphus]|uniref:FAD:protein FMN transferase n=1 Tax=Thalassoglobus polymorphus TaxID=2527994 RepID=A0A517QSS7_9PLAN|nr:FAD:protein FMN transferase [Thalassoglobus polymorphus]QDT34682.1 Thiamine biosynthesis lipoprotein ApbE precursor [Thalassoglobus polymorphus]
MPFIYRFLFLAVPFACLPGFVFAEEPTKIAGETMGTTYHISWIGNDSKPDEIQQLVDAQLVQINKLMSTYDPDSELSRFNKSTQTDWFPVSEETATVVQAALEISKLSKGAFDPTVGRLVRLWNFGSGPHTNEPPTDEEIQKALKSVGYKLINVRTDPPAISKSNPDAELDLSAIAKGFGVDVVFELLQDQGIENFMVEIGGEVRAAGTKNGVPWTIAIERPESLTQSMHAKVELTDEALATSGNYRNYFIKDDVRYSHTIDPRTGKPVTHQLASVSIVAKNCMHADAWATTLMVMGSEEGLKLAEANHLSAYLLERQGDDFRELSSSDVAEKFVKFTQAQNEKKKSMSPMLTTFLLAAAVFAIALIGLAAGVILSNKTLKGSCGGIAGTKDEQGNSICELCTTPPEECDQFKEKLREQLKEDSKN